MKIPQKVRFTVGAMSGINGSTNNLQMKIEVFTKPNCPNCVAAKQLLNKKNLEYREINLDSDGLRAEFMSAYPEARQMPQIFFDGQRVGGLAGLQVALNQLELL